MPIFVICGIVAGWLFLGYWGSAAVAKYFVARYGPTLKDFAWKKDDKTFEIFAFLAGPVRLATALLFLYTVGAPDNILHPLWSWPFWTYSKTKN